MSTEDPTADLSDDDVLREHLRALMSECLACVPEDADDIPADELEGWIESHGGITDVARLRAERAERGTRRE